MAVGLNYTGFALYRRKGLQNERIAGYLGKQQGFYRAVGLTAEFGWTKSQSPRYSLGLGPMVTNDKCIKP